VPKRGLTSQAVAHICEELRHLPHEALVAKLAELLHENKVDKLGACTKRARASP
jgi:hypothetical protein